MRPKLTDNLLKGVKGKKNYFLFGTTLKMFAARLR